MNGKLLLNNNMAILYKFLSTSQISGEHATAGLYLCYALSWSDIGSELRLYFCLQQLVAATWHRDSLHSMIPNSEMKRVKWRKMLGRTKLWHQLLRVTAPIRPSWKLLAESQHPNQHLTHRFCLLFFYLYVIQQEDSITFNIFRVY